MNKKSEKIYKILRLGLFFGAFFGAIILTFSIVFSEKLFTFNFENPRAAKNTLANPRNEKGESSENGKIKKGEYLIIDAAALGNFSSSQIKFFLSENENENFDNFKGAFLSVKKGYQALFYPFSGEIGFPDGELLKSEEKYYIVSGGLLRKFRNLEQLKQMGFNEENFLDVSQKALNFNEKGKEVGNDYPIETIFKIGNQYYKQEKDFLKKFINPDAYLSYGRDRAIKKDSSWISEKNVSKEKIGFADGSLLAYGMSAFVVSDGLILPIGDATIFESKGFSWDDLISVGGDTISFYEKGKLFELDSPHPSGTIFFEKEYEKYFLVKNKKIYLLPNIEIMNSWKRKMSTFFSEKSFEETQSCNLSIKKTIFGKKYLGCDLQTQNLDNILGTDFEFYLKSEKPVIFSNAEVVLKRNVNQENFDIFLENIIGRIKQHYYEK